MQLHPDDTCPSTEPLGSRTAGRFDRLIYVGLPTLSSRGEILRVHTSRMPLAPDVSLAKLAESTDGYSGAELAALCREAAQAALHETLESLQVRQRRRAHTVCAVAGGCCSSGPYVSAQVDGG